MTRRSRDESRALYALAVIMASLAGAAACVAAAMVWGALR